MPAPGAAEQVLDDFEDVSGWTASASPGASVEIARDTGPSGSAMRLDFDLQHGGFVIARKAFALTLPRDYAFTFWLRGEAPPNTFEFKLIDASANVWWSQRHDFVFPSEWKKLTTKQSRVQFAWGPAAGAPPRRIAFIEIAIAAGEGGKGSVWLDDLRFEEREPYVRGDLRPTVTASTLVEGHEPALAIDQRWQTTWRSGTLAPEQWLLLDFRRRREYGGLVLDWDAADYATGYRVEVSDDAESWMPVYESTTGNGGRDYIYAPDGESRYIRLTLAQSSRGQGYALAEVTVKPTAFSNSLNQFFEAIADDAPPGAFPKYFSGRQTYWTVVGVDGDDKEALLNEEGMLEVDKHGFSIEPFLYADGALVTWNDVLTSQALEGGSLPIPSVTWTQERIGLRVRAFATGRAGASNLYASYEVENRGDVHQDVVLFLALRPFQVLPPWQSLNMVGGVTRIQTLDFETRTVTVNGERHVISLTPPVRFGAATFEQDLISDFLRQGRVPLEPRVADSFGYASGALEYRFSLEPGARDEVHLAVPFHPPIAPAISAASDVPAHVASQLATNAREWRTLLGRVALGVPASSRKLVDVLESALAYMLINRDGPAIQPGSRNYARSWIRDGAFSTSALLELGHTEEPRAFLEWYAPFQFPDGRVPCCVDRRGPDTVREHDSNGELIFTIAEYYRFTRDVGFLYALWPHVTRAVGAIEALRAQRMTDVYKTPEKLAYFGLLPESISHEGYSSHPVHSYWDDFFTLRGLKDAALIARIVGDPERAARYAELRDAFRNDLHASIKRTMEVHKIDYIPASVELGDFDPSSTAIAIWPAGEAALLPADALARTYGRYYDEVQERLRTGATGDAAHSAYELRNVEVFVRLGQRERAYEILQALLGDLRPAAWNAWQEVTWHDPTTPRFIGDMPHTWIGASYVHSLRSMFGYEREEDSALVIAAGIPGEWLAQGDADGIGVTRLPTHYGVLSYRLTRDTPTALRLRLSGDLNMPSGGIVIAPPLPGPLTAVTVNGKPAEPLTPMTVRITEFPAEVVLEH